ncbi:MAG: hypothetical protein CMF25_03115 [Kangiellaceae bacterium]|jgi:hypothetical protein|nr:hypothetical protein [Kangiellaceae bacterium]|tara:strand:- start:367 stop:879 length:513 start_codon:yes stop_codon:yes gene_type:complete
MEASTLVIGGIVIIVVAVIGYFVAAHLKGEINIRLRQTSYRMGDTISGSFELLAKKPIEGNRLFMTLTAQEITKEYRDGKSHTRTRTIFSEDTEINGPNMYAAGSRKNYSFEVAIPSLQSNSFLNSSWGKALSAVLSVLGDNKRIEWKLKATLDAKGVDISDSVKLHITE